MAGTLDFAGMVPGLDFLQSLMKGSAAAAPPMGQWIAPTLDPAELDKRIGELRTVQFWLEQNSKLLGASIQAMEVQRMTLATLQTMNLPMADLRDALKIKPAPAEARWPASAAFTPTPTQASAPGAPGEPAATDPAVAPAAPAVDPLQWWGALTQQFTDIANKTLQQGAAEASRLAAATPQPAAQDAPRRTTKAATPRASAKEPAAVAPRTRRAAAR